MQPDFDILFLGGGNFATMAVTRLLEEGYEGRIGVVDRRTAFSQSHRWCSWWRNSSPLPRGTSTEWRGFCFKNQGASSKKLLKEWKYIHVDAASFYAQHHSIWAGYDYVTRLFGVSVDEVKRTPGGETTVYAGGRSWTARLVVDSRYRTDQIPEEAFAATSGWWQSFYGKVVVGLPGEKTDALPTLMDLDLTTAGRFSFGYILPFEDGTQLIEYTAFARAAQPLGRMRERLQSYTNTAKSPDASLIAEEHGWLPMVAEAANPIDQPGYWHGGLRGGSARPSTGFAFYRNARRAEAVVHAVMHSQSTPAVSKPGIAEVLDRIFLETLVDSPKLTRTVMARLLERLSGDEFASFLAEDAGFKVVQKVIWNLPKLPFVIGAIRCAYRRLLQKRVATVRSKAALPWAEKATKVV